MARGGWLCLLIGVACAGACPAQVHVGAGVADEIDGEHAGVATVSWLGSARHPWEVVAGYIRPRERPAGRLPDATFLALGRRMTWRGWFAGGGIAWVSEDNDVLSGHVQFLTGIGHDFGTATLIVRHPSNGGFKGRNRREAMLKGGTGV